MKLIRIGLASAAVLALAGTGIALAAPAPTATQAVAQDPADKVGAGETADTASPTISAPTTKSAASAQQDNGQDGETADDSTTAGK